MTRARPRARATRAPEQPAHPERLRPTLCRAKAEFVQTLARPARIRILELLSEREHAVHELLDSIEIEARKLSQQFAVRRRARPILQRREHGAVLNTVSVPAVCDLLLAARSILPGLIEDREEIKPDRRPIGN